MPWTEKIDEVPHNHEICLAILNKVINKLDRDSLYDRYNAVLQQQLDDCIIEEVPANDMNLSDHKFVPHRPVIREDSSTPKLRIVLNCSLKTGNAPSLNEAAYPGVDLGNNLFQLLLRVRADDYIVMSDIKSAYLQIRLNKVSDKNKFTIIWRNRNGNLIYYRYNSIVFGYVSSSFILQRIIQFHLQNYARDDCYNVISKGIYVDNLFFTSNKPDYLHQMYRDVFERMSQGGLELRSWATNESTLSEVFADDNRASSSSTCEKLLGYTYIPEHDILKINAFERDFPDSVTKRSILSYSSRVFDPLELTLPVTVGVKLLLRELWESKIEWDEPVPDDISKRWMKLKHSLDSLPELSYPRRSYSGDVNLYIFCDASKSQYGFTVYVKSLGS